jgi:TPP-dependent pyruvate/acetoin dehydrogenase alpha subunit
VRRCAEDCHINLASVWNLPILDVYENNQFLAFVRRQETMLTDHVADWTRLKGIETARIDGNDTVLRSLPGTQLKE